MTSAVAVHEMVRGRPALALAPFVRDYEGYRFDGFAPGTHQGLPSGSMTFIVSLDGPIDLVALPGDQSPRLVEAFVGGLHVSPATIAHPGFGAGISIGLSPLGCRALFGVPAAALASQVVDLADVLGRSAGSAGGLVERLRTAPAWPQRFALLDAALTAAFARSPGYDPVRSEVRRAWDLLAHSGGRAPVAAVAEDVGWSRRHLSTSFAAELGVTPKVAARLLRFERTCGLLDRGLGLAEAAVAGGYYDQSHLNREWRELAGVTPTVWQADELRDRSVDDEP